MRTPRISSRDILLRKGGDKIVMSTCYDYAFAKLLDAKMDILLVGDSVGMVVQGMPTTLGVRLEDILYHTRSVVRGTQRAHVVADLPFLTYQCSREEAMRNAGRLLAEGGAEAVKLEGGKHMAPTITALVEIGIPVMAHVGLTPQSVHAFGGFRIQGKTQDSAARILEDAHAVQEAGAYALVLEGIPADLAAQITQQLRIPTIGIGAGVQCDGQVLVLHDWLGMDADFAPRFVKKYSDLSTIVGEAASRFAGDIRAGRFPGKEQSF